MLPQIEEAYQDCKRRVERNRLVRLNFRLFLPGGKTLVIFPQTRGVPDESIDRAKDLLVDTVVEMIHRERPEAILLVLEAWFKRIPFSGDKAEDEAALERVEQRGVRAEPDREEGVVFYHETPNSIAQYLSRIRTIEGKRTLLPPERMRAVCLPSSRMAHLYQKARDYADRRDR
jgi:hypothetical protein